MASMSLQAAYDQARQWLESNDLDRAIGLAQHILDHYPDNLEAYRILGEAHLANRQLDRAQESFERVLRSDPENIPAHVGLGITSERQGQLDRAVAEFEQALEIKPDMAELRSQLLRLYTEGWGSENAQLRLSRAGLARLYAKGHMLPQAISEFRQVIADQPGRFDAMVALAETLWRDGQEEDAMALCRDILAQRPESLKANLLLGYLLMTSGDPDGERYWRAAERMDPYHGVARALFETLPPSAGDAPEIEEWDEAAWRQRRAAEQQEQIGATRPMEAVTPVGTAVAAATFADHPPARPAPVALPGDGDDFLASLLAIETPALPPTPPAADVSDEDLGLNIDMAPFSLESLGDDQRAANPPAEAPPADDASATMEPFSLADLGLSEDEIAGMDSLGAIDAAPAPAPEPDEPTMTPFSLSDLGLSDDEIAGMDSLGAIDAAPAPAPEPDEPAMTPFSLSDLGLSDDEIAGMDSLGAIDAAPAPAPEPDEPAMTPFSLSDLGLSDDEIAGMDSLGAIDAAPAPTHEAPPALDEDDIKISPFSLSDLGLSEDEIAGLDSLEAQSTSAAPPASGAPEAGGDMLDMDDLPLDLHPFSIDELDLGSADTSNTGIGELPTSLQPFSLDEAPPPRPRVSGFVTPESADNENIADEEDFTPETRGFSWQQASQKPEPSFLKTPREEPGSDASIFAKLKQRHLSNPEEREPPPLPPVSIDPEEHLGLFSMDDISLRDDAGASTLETQAPVSQPESAPAQPAAPEPPAALEIDNLEDAVAAGQVQPFSLADLGLSEEEIAAMGIGDAASVRDTSPATQQNEETASQPEPPAALEIDNLEDAVAAGQVQPFSLADLGLSEEEIAAMGLGEPAAPEPPALEIDNLEDAVAAGQVQPFSLADLGLSEEEIAAMGLSDATSAETPASQQPEPESVAEIDQAPDQFTQPADSIPSEEAQPTDAAAEESSLLTSDLKPFSLTDLGLSEDEISALGLDASADVDESGTGLDITEEELEGLDGGDLNWARQPAAPVSGQPEPQLITGDLVVDRLIALGRQQGYVDIADIMADFEDPEAEAGRIEEIGRRLHEAQIEIRDGDEVIDMDADYEEDEAEQTDEAMAAPDMPAPAAPAYPARDLDLATHDNDQLGAAAAEASSADIGAEPTSDEPSMTPFSLSELGLSEDEINALGLGEPAAPAEPSAVPAEPELTPFSLSELGLSDDEIAALGLGEPTTPAEPAAPTEPDMTPFSLNELGLSEDEIAALDLGEPTAPAETPAPADPDMTPFSLNELGLSEDEIAALDLGEASVSEAPDLPAEQQDIAEPSANQVEAREPEPAREEPKPTAPAESPAALPAATPPARAAAPAGRHADSEAPVYTGNDIVDSFLRQLETEPQNDVLRISLARIGWQIGIPDLAVQQYKYLIKHNRSLDQVVDEINDLLSDSDEEKLMQRLHRTLGDAYTKQGRFREAVEEYSWTLGGPRGARK
jgi:tetratricopeptide (TPR) repeat protein/uncharacterized protein YjiS (DUF1127 family)